MRYVWTAMFAVAVLALAFGPGLLRREAPADEELQIISPHWSGIKTEFARAFREQYLHDTGKHIQVTWLDMGSTGEIRQYLDERFSQAGPERGVGADILFGGGMDIIPRMANQNYFEPYELSAAQQQELPATVDGLELRDPQCRYLAACLASFGFVYNEKVLALAKLPEPKEWADLGRPEFQSWVSCGDPGLSGSVHAAFETVLQGSGWERGYQNLARMASNTRAFNEGGSSVPRDVALGQAAVGPCIDFYASAPARRQGVTHVRLVVPKEQAAVTADCIAIFRHPPNAKAARAFMAFVLGETGQRLWYQKRGQPGGPKDYDLERLPVMPRIYEMGLETNTVMNPFKTKTAFTYDSKKAGARWGLLNDLWRAMWSDVHAQLFEARRAVSAAGRDEDLGMLMTQAPIGEEAFLKLARKHMTADERNALRNRWSAWARGWYGKIRRAAETGGEAPAWEGL